MQGACYLTGEDPIEVQAAETKMLPDVYAEVDETLCWTMKFPSGIIANCSTSYTCGLNRLFVTGDTGWGELSPAFGYFDDIQLRTCYRLPVTQIGPLSSWGSLLRAESRDTVSSMSALSSASAWYHGYHDGQ